MQDKGTVVKEGQTFKFAETFFPWFKAAGPNQ